MASPVDQFNLRVKLIPKLRIFSLISLEILLKYFYMLYFFKGYKIYRIEFLEKWD